VHVLWQINVLLTIYGDNDMFDNNPNFPIINIYKNMCMNLLLIKNDISKYSWLIKYVIHVFKDSLIKYWIWNIINDMGRWPTLSSLQMALFDDKSFKLIIWKLLIFYHMNLKCLFNLWKHLNLLLTLQNRIKDENFVVK
jgi:hypothetical protein